MFIIKENLVIKFPTRLNIIKKFINEITLPIGYSNKKFIYNAVMG